MRNRRPASIFFTAVLLIVLYFALFPHPLGKELVPKPVWAVQVGGASSNTALAAAAQSSAGLAAAPFRLADSFGYVSPDGALLHVGQRLFQVALSRTGYINFARMGTDWIFRDPRGERVASFSGNGYPLLSDDGSRILVVGSDLTGMRELDKNGDAVWSRDFPAIMTSVSLQGDFLLVGLLNGSLQLLNRNGVPVYQAPPGQSRIPVIYGCAVAPDGSYIASVSGTGPQELTVLGRNGSSYARALHVTLPTDYRREVRMGFSPDSRCLFYESAGSIGLAEPGTGWLSSIPLPGRLAGAAFLEDSRVAAFLSRDGQQANLKLVSPFLLTFASESFPAGELFLGAIDGQLLLGVDGRLLRVDMMVM
jgi:hypothetical protein